MKVVAVGRLDDIRGFALAGVETVRCETLQDAGAMVQALSADASIGLILLPASCAAAASAAIGLVRGQRRAPVILELPHVDADH
jgi:vacuolar-type H+-ATPase subunit F/Vma7